MSHITAAGRVGCRATFFVGMWTFCLHYKLTNPPPPPKSTRHPEAGEAGETSGREAKQTEKRRSPETRSAGIDSPTHAAAVRLRRAAFVIAHRSLMHALTYQLTSSLRRDASSSLSISVACEKAAGEG